MVAAVRWGACLCLMLALLVRPTPGRAETVSFASGSYIVPMDTTYQDNGMLLAYGMVYRLLRDGVPVEWVIEPTKAHLGDDFTASAVDHVSRAVIPARGYRGGPFVIHAADVARARPLIDAWQALYPAVTVHEATVSFDAFVARHLVAAPTIATFADGNEPIAFGYMNAAGIPDSAGRAWPGARVSCPSTNPDVMCPAQVAGGYTSHQDGSLFEADGTPVYCQMMSMHWDVRDARTALGEEVIREYRSFLQYPTHLFAECQAVNAIENSVNGLFLTSMGYEIDARPSTYTYYDDGLPYAQIDGAFLSVGGSEPSYSLPVGGTYLAMDTVMVTAAGSPIGTRDVWMTGYIDGACPIGVECPGGFGGLGKVSYLGGHRYPTDLPISRNPDTNGVRYFLNALFEASCATAAGRPILRVVKSAPEIALLDTVTYTLDYENSGSGIARDVVLRDAIPAGSTFVSADSGGTFDGTAVSWNLGALAQWDAGSVSFTVRLGAPGHYTNRASLTYLAGVTPGSTTSNTTDTAWGLDQDADGLMDSDEVAFGTSWLDCDSDDDGVSDGDEVFVFGTEPLYIDTDGDTLADGAELGYVRDCPASCHTPSRCACAGTGFGFVPDTDCTTTTDPLDPLDPPRCGDTLCNGLETCDTCPADCGVCPPPPPTCPDGLCNGIETCTSCPADCGVCPPVCGDGACNGTETCAGCPADCGVCPPVCGDGTCNGTETCTSCPTDCGACPPVCGDGACNGTETCAGCPADCGVCPPVCGDGTCNGTETCAGCPGDCGACPPICGDGACNGTETCATCPTDCSPCTGSCGDASCESDETCETCPADCGACVDCGNYRCEPGEDCASCSLDCGTCPGTCGDGVCDATETCASCEAECGVCSTTCGDGICTSDETCASCAAECGPCGADCGNYVCEPGETCASCELDCGACSGTCGDGTCDPDEDCASCELDCGACTGTCGDGTCDADEDCASCEADCGACTGTCGDGTCDADEDCASCEADCGACTGTCGDGTCDADEDCASCEADCGACTGTCGDGTCDADEDCASCEADCGACTGTCGDGTCDADEDCASCPDDCACPDGGDDGGGDGTGDDGETVGDTGDTARDDADGGDGETVGDGEDAVGDGSGPDGTGTSGCGCVVPARRDPGIWPLLGALVGLLAVRRERRRRQAASARPGCPDSCGGPSGPATGSREAVS